MFKIKLIIKKKKGLVKIKIGNLKIKVSWCGALSALVSFVNLLDWIPFSHFK